MALPTKTQPSTLPELFDRFSDWRWPFTRTWPEVWRSFGETLPAVDMFRENGTIVVKAEIPGATADEVEATVEGDVLTIRRQHKQEKEEKEKSYYYREQRSESFVRQLQLPERVDEAKTEATLKDGVLTIKLTPAGPAPATQKIPITADGG